MLKNTTKFLLTLVALLVAGTLCAKEVIKVGVVTPMSGDFAVLQEIVDVMDARADEISEDPDSLFEYEYIFEDSRFDPKTSNLAAQKLLNVDKVDVIVSIASLSGKVVVPLANRKGITHLILGGEELADGKLNFTYFNAASDTMGLVASTLKALGYESYLCLGRRQEAAFLIVKAMDEAAAEYGLENKGDFLWNSDGVKDFRPYIMKAQGVEAQAWVYFPTPPDPDIFFRQAIQLGVQEPISGVESYEIVSDKSLVEGQWIAGCPPLDDAILARLNALGIEAKLTYSPFAYDLPGIIAQAAELASPDGHKPSSKEIAAAVAQLKTIQTTQGEVRLDDKGAFHPMPVLVYYEDGVGRQVSVEELIEIKEGKL